jgi:uncharacterized beta barrel domain-containing protein DUF5777
VTSTRTLLIALMLAAVIAAPALAQSSGTTGDPAQAQAAAQPPPDDDPDRDLNVSQPDFNLAALPTTLRLPRFKSSFRVTHRFGRPLGDGDFGDLVEDLFGLDNGAGIGLEYRFGIFRGAQVGIHRTSISKTIEFFGEYSVKAQRDGFPFGIVAMATVEGTNNFHDEEDEGIQSSVTPSIGLLLSREIGDHGAIYVEPFWVNNTNPQPEELVDDNNTVIIGLGARLRLGRSTYVVVEGAPRVSGYDPGVTHVSFGIEKRAGGHLFQLNFSNDFATTMGQIARGGFNNDDWYLGFNISRKFF